MLTMQSIYIALIQNPLGIIIQEHKHTPIHRKTHHKQIPTMATSTTATISAMETTTMMIMFTVWKAMPVGEGEKAGEGSG